MQNWCANSFAQLVEGGINNRSGRDTTYSPSATEYLVARQLKLPHPSFAQPHPQVLSFVTVLAPSTEVALGLIEVFRQQLHFTTASLFTKRSGGV